jgi:hypothetical protein
MHSLVLAGRKVCVEANGAQMDGVLIGLCENPFFHSMCNDQDSLYDWGRNIRFFRALRGFSSAASSKQFGYHGHAHISTFGFRLQYESVSSLFIGPRYRVIRSFVLTLPYPTVGATLVATADESLVAGNENFHNLLTILCSNRTFVSFRLRVYLTMVDVHCSLVLFASVVTAPPSQC